MNKTNMEPSKPDLSWKDEFPYMIIPVETSLRQLKTTLTEILHNLLRKLLVPNGKRDSDYSH